MSPEREVDDMRTRYYLLLLIIVALVLIPACGSDDGPTPPPPPPDLSMQYDEVTWLTSHNAFAYFDWTATDPEDGLCVNQQTSIARQLQNGVRAFQLDIHFWDNNDPLSEPVVYLCHGTRELPIPSCAQLRFTPLVEELEVIAAFLAANPTEVVTIMFEDYVNDQTALEAPFQDALIPGSSRTLMEMVYNPSGDVWNVDDQGSWPTLQWMVDNDQRLVVFSDEGYDHFATGGHYFRGNAWDPIALDETDCQLKGDLSNYDGKMFLMYHLSGPRLMNGWKCPELSMEYTPDQLNTATSIINRWENSCAPELGHPPGFLSVDFADGCPKGQDLCDPTAIVYTGPLDAVKYFNEEVWPSIRNQ